MKRILTSVVMSFCLFAAIQLNAQTLTVNNTSACTVQFYAGAEAPGCVTGQTGTIVLGGGTSFTFNPASITWPGGVPPLGWVWSWWKGGALAGPYAGGAFACTNPISNINVAAVGPSVCVGGALPLATCMNLTACVPVKVQWVPVGGGNIVVNIW